MGAPAAGLIVARWRIFVNSVQFLVRFGKGVQLKAIKRHALATDGKLIEVWAGILLEYRSAHAEVFRRFADPDEAWWGR